MKSKKLFHRFTICLPLVALISAHARSRANSSLPSLDRRGAATQLIVENLQSTTER